jgi:hypothetical protein
LLVVRRTNVTTPLLVLVTRVPKKWTLMALLTLTLALTLMAQLLQKLPATSLVQSASRPPTRTPQLGVPLKVEHTLMQFVLMVTMACVTSPLTGLMAHTLTLPLPTTMAWTAQQLAPMLVVLTPLAK